MRHYDIAKNQAARVLRSFVLLQTIDFKLREIDEFLARRAATNILSQQMDEVLIAEAALGFCALMSSASTRLL